MPDRVGRRSRRADVLELIDDPAVGLAELAPPSLLELGEPPSYRPRRRRPPFVAAGVGAILVAALGLVVGRADAGPERSADLAPAPIEADMLEAIARRALGTAGVPAGGGFVDPRRGYLLLARCPTPEEDACTGRLVTTADGGANFTTRPLPTDGRPIHWANLWVFGDGGLVFDAEFAGLAPDTPPADRGFRRWASADAGLTWRAASTAFAGTVDAIPAGAKLIEAPPTDPDRSGRPSVLTSEGRTYELATVPRPSRMVAGRFGPWAGDAVGGSFFLTDGDGGLLVSTDRGASWRPGDTPVVGAVSIVGAGGGRVYGMLEPDESGPTSSEPPVLWNSTDSGRGWNAIALPRFTPLRGADPDGYGEEYLRNVTMAVLPTGEVLMADGVRLWRLPPGGHAFAPIPSDGIRMVLGLPGVAVAIRGDQASVATCLSTDGRTWRPVHPG